MGHHRREKLHYTQPFAKVMRLVQPFVRGFCAFDIFCVLYVVCCVLCVVCVVCVVCCALCVVCCVLCVTMWLPLGARRGLQ